MKQGLKVILSFSLPVHLSVFRCANTLVPSGMSSWRKRRERGFKPIRNHAVHGMVRKNGKHKQIKGEDKYLPKKKIRTCHA